MKKTSHAGLVFALISCWIVIPSANAELTSILVSGPNYAHGAGYDTQYELKSVSLYVDPAATNWIAWSDSFGSASADPYTCPAGTCVGRHGFGTNDYIKMQVTNPLGSALTLNMDWNDGIGNSTGPQMVLFGAAAAAPDVRRYNSSGSFHYYINEGGAFNSLFTTAGTYQFDFSFRNLWGYGPNQAGHENVYLLSDVTNPIPEPESYVMLLAGLGLLGILARRRQERAVQLS